MRLLSLALAAVLGAAGCKARPIDASEPCPSWKGEVAAIVSTRCTSCHGGATPAGGYDLSTYATAIDKDALGRLDDVLVPSDSVHSVFVDLAPSLERWAGECEVAYLSSSLHAHGILDPSNTEEFHGRLVEQQGWRLTLCAQCHGADFRGGTAKAACTTCHTAPGGPTACTTCHENPPSMDAHGPHLAAGVDCTECHIVPATYDAPGHPPTPDKLITFGPLANKGGGATYTPATKTCAAVYCHGGTLADSAATTTTPKWDSGAAAGTCGACHGLPPANHKSGSTPCAACHGLVAGAGNKIIDEELHVDGIVEVGDGSGSTCSSCHPDSSLSGAHLGHINGSRFLRGPLACSECHIVPATVDSPGHIDSGPPAELTFGALAKSDGAAAAFDPAAKSCSAVYCHGGGAKLAGDTSPTLVRAPTWTGPLDQAVCGTCHGVPPTTIPHNATMTLRDCGTCHSASVDGFGNIKFNNGQSKHLDGVIDAG